MLKNSFTISLIIFLISITGAISIAMRSVPVVVRTNLENIPMHIDNYQGTEDSFPESVYKTLNADKNIYRHYRSPNGKEVDLYIGYYGTAKGGRTGHNPNACLPGAGWGIVDTHTVQIEVPYYPKGASVNYVLSRKGSLYLVMYYWYQSAGDEILATGFRQNIQRFIGRLLYNRNDGGFIRITALTDQQHIDITAKTAKSFAATIATLLPKYWPVEK